MGQATTEKPFRAQVQNFAYKEEEGGPGQTVTLAGNKK